ncbi:aldose 1-epimerase family protein [Fibrobacterales bacterium]|nr:aldose 1-epimerase family protein [Fibrobacterales bacterium]
MLHTIENNQFICIIESNGAQIRSLKNKITNEEYIWQIDKSVWEHSSPVIFPSIGILKDDKFIHNGIDYKMPKHGFIRGNEKLIHNKVSPSKCTFSLNSSDDTLRIYPFRFSFSVEYTLIKNRLIMSYQVSNNDSTPIFFACGGHTAYSCALDESIKLSDYVLEFPHEVNLETNTMLDSGLLSLEKREIVTNGNFLALSDELFNKDFLIFSDLNCDWIRLRKKHETQGVVIHFKDYPHLALWSKPGADFICIEPWFGLPDFENESVILSEKKAHKTIKPNEKFSIDITTEIES